MSVRYLKLPYHLDDHYTELEDLHACGYFSVDGDCNYHNDSSEMKYVYPLYENTQTLDQPFDLDLDYEKIVPKKVKENELTNIWRWVRENPDKAEGVVSECFLFIINQSDHGKACYHHSRHTLIIYYCSERIVVSIPR